MPLILRFRLLLWEWSFPKMSDSVFVWALAIVISSATLLLAPEYFQLTLITRVFHQILCHPIPYWSIIFLSFIGTFTSIYFGDEMIDVITHNKRVKLHKHGMKYKAMMLVGITFLVIVIYYQLISDLGIKTETIF